MAEPIVIWGAGAIGASIGARLRKAGHEVLFVDIVPEHVEAIRAGKLRIEGPVVDITVDGQAALPTEVKGKFKTIILAVKAHHTVGATQALLPHLADDGIVVSCQNGLNELEIAPIVGRERTIGSFVNFSADYIEPGRILYGGRGAVVVGELNGDTTTPRIVELHRLMKIFDEDAILSDNIFGYLWGKAGYGAILKASALTNDTIADFIDDPARRTLILRLVREILAVAKADGVTPLGFNGFDPQAFMANDAEGMAKSLDILATFNRGSSKTRSGIWRDLAVRKRTTDVGAQLAPVRACARGHGLKTPIADHLVELIASVERREREQGKELGDELSATAEKAPA